MAWLETWGNRRKITISNTNVDEDLSNFPILVHLSASSGTGSDDITDVFGQLGGDANRKRIAVTTSDGITQCYVEIERFDYANSEAWLWVKAPSVSTTVVTELYIYYDSAQADNTTYVGDTGDTAAQNVWDSNFVMVQHMEDVTVSTVKGSTSNVNNGTKVSANQPIEATGKIGNGQDYDGSADQISIPLSSLFNMPEGTGTTISAIVKPSVVDTLQTIYSLRHSGSFSYFVLWINTDGNLRLAIADNDRSNTISTDSSIPLFADTFYHIAVVREEDGTLKAFINGTSEELGFIVGNITNSNQGPYIGNHYYDSAQHQSFDGIIDEVRVSSVARSEAWLKASYYNDYDNLVSFGESIALSGANIDATLPAISASIIESNLLDVTLPSITTEVEGGNGGFLETTIPAIVAEVEGEQGVAILATLPAIAAEMEGTTTAVALSATLPAITSEIKGASGGSLEATLPSITSDIKGGAILEASLPAITASLEGDAEIAGDLIVSLPAITANLEGKVNIHGDLTCVLPAITSELTGTMEVSGNLACALPMITAGLTGFQDISGDLVAALPMITAFIEGTTGLADDDGDPIDADECGIILRYSKVGY